MWIFYFVDNSARLTIIDEDMRHNWGHYMRIKDELLGINWEGIELYPAHDRLVDIINAYHIWCRPTPFSIGWRDGATYSANGACFTGATPIDDLIEKVAGIVKAKKQAERRSTFAAVLSRGFHASNLLGGAS